MTTTAGYYTKYKKSDKSVYLISVLNLAASPSMIDVRLSVTLVDCDHTVQRKVEIGT